MGPLFWAQPGLHVMQSTTDFGDLMPRHLLPPSLYLAAGLPGPAQTTRQQRVLLFTVRGRGVPAECAWSCYGPPPSSQQFPPHRQHRRRKAARNRGPTSRHSQGTQSCLCQRGWVPGADGGLTVLVLPCTTVVPSHQWSSLLSPRCLSAVCLAHPTV